MVRVLACGILALSLGAPLPAGAQSFEGKIRMRTISVDAVSLLELVYGAEEAEAAAEAPELSADQVFDIPTDRIVAMAEAEEGAVSVSEMNFYLTGDRIRVDGEAGLETGGFMLIDFATGAMRMVMPEERIYLEITAEDMERMRAEGAGEEQGAGSPQVRALGMTREISGMRCAAYEVRYEDELARVWVAAELRDVANAFNAFVERMRLFGMAEGEEEAGLEVFEAIKQHGFPAMVQTLRGDPAYPDSYEIEDVLSVERGSLPASLFEIPASYEKKSLEDLLQLFGGG
jgi:hypothetical protein